MSESSQLALFTISELKGLQGSTLNFTSSLKELQTKGTQTANVLKFAFSEVKEPFKKLLDTTISYRSELKELATQGAALINSSINAANQSEIVLGKFKTIFRGATESTMGWTDTFGKQIGRSKWDIMDLTSEFGLIFKTMGLGEQETSSLSEQMTRLAADMGAMYQKSPEEAAQALMGALKESTGGMGQFGIAMDDSEMKLEALKKGIVGTNGELTALQVAQAKVGILLQKGAEANGYAAQNANSYNGQLGAFKANINDLSASLGQEYLPVVTRSMTKVNEFLSSLKGADMKNIAWVAGLGTATFQVAAGISQVNDKLPFLKDFLLNPKMLLFSLAIAGLVWVVNELWIALSGGQSVLSPLVDWFKKYGDIIKWAGIALGIFFGPAIIMGAIGKLGQLAKAIKFVGFAFQYNWVTATGPAIKSIADLTLGAWKFVGTIAKAGLQAVISFGRSLITSIVSAFPALIAGFSGAVVQAWAFTAALLANPITWIVVGVIALIGGLFLLWKNWNTVVAAFQKGFDWVRNIFLKGWGAVVNFFKNLGNIIGTAVSSLWNNVINGIKKGFEWFKDNLMKGWGAVVNFFKNLPNFIATAVSSIWNNVINGFKKGFQWLKDLFFKAPNWVIGLIAAFVPIIGIPLLIIKNWGAIVSFFKNIGNSIGQFFRSLWDSAVNFVNNFISSIGSFIAGIGNFFNGIFNSIGLFFSSLWNMAVNLLNNIVNLLGSIFGGIGDFFIGIFNNIGSFFNSIWNGIINALSGFGKLIENILPPWVKDIFNWLMNAGKGVINFFGGLFGGKNQKQGNLPGNQNLPTSIISNQGILTSTAGDQRAANQLNQSQNNRIVNTKNTKVDKIEINLTGGKNDQQTVKVIRNELLNFFGQQGAATLGG